MTGRCLESDLELQKYPNAYLHIGKAECFTNYFKNGNIVEYPPKPEGFYTFDFDTESWVIDLQATESAVLKKRDNLLAEGPDRISTLWWASMSEQEQQAWTFYRQALLDITEQDGYPEFIVWPIKP